MSKFCQNCGNQLDDNVVFCPNCGAKEELPAAAPAPEAPIYTAPAPEAPAYTAPQAPAYGAPEAPAYTAPQAPVYGAPAYAAPEGYAAPAPKDNKKLIIGIIAAVAAIAVIVVLALVLFGGGRGGYLGAIDTYLEVREGDIDAIADLAPAEYWEYIEDEEEISLDDVLEECNRQYEQAMEHMSYTPSYSFSETACEELDADEVELIGEALDKRYGVKASTVTAVYEVEGMLEASYSGYEDTNEANLVVAEIDGEYYIIDYTEYDDGYNVRFDGAQDYVNMVDD